ncbi:MAG: DUF4332 domain-containing protein [Deltaproteobacteria bacterium]|nr:MAG: DUF4332 domain-containing protein [Deltaproteobacteria bacterium]
MVDYRISEIEGIGAVYAAKLRDVGIMTVGGLLEKGKTAKGRRDLSKLSGIDARLILKWVNMSDLFRVSGIGKQYAELLKAAGVDTVKELRNRNPRNLQEKLKETNGSGRQLVRSIPGVKVVEAWVNAAKKMKPEVTH